MILFVEERAIVAVALSAYVQANYLVPIVHNVDLFAFDYCWRSDACIGPILIASIVGKLFVPNGTDHLTECPVSGSKESGSPDHVAGVFLAPLRLISGWGKMQDSDEG